MQQKVNFKVLDGKRFLCLPEMMWEELQSNGQNPDKQP